MFEIVTRLPGELISGAVVDVDSCDAGEHSPAAAVIFWLVLGDALPHHRWRIDAEGGSVIGQERRGGADDVFSEADRGRVPGGKQVCADDVLDFDAPVKIFVHLRVVVRIGLPHLLVIVFFWEKRDVLRTMQARP